MSVINQVLNQLEQRGEHAAPEQTMVRAVPHRGKDLTIPALVMLGVVMVGLAVWQWLPMRKSDTGVASTAQHQPQPQPQPVAVVAAVPAVPPEIVMAEIFPPVSRLSINLSAVPLPSAPTGSKSQTVPKPAAPPQMAVVPGKPAQNATPTVQAVLKNEPKASSEARPNAGGELPMKRISPAQQADAEFRKAAALMQQGRIADAIGGYQTALQLDAGHQAARQALVALLLEGKRGADAERVLQEGLNAKPEQTGFAMLLARLQVERGALEAAVATLERYLSQAGTQGDYHAFLAAVVQRQSRHEEAVKHYLIALQQAPDNSVWLMGYGISLQAVQRGAEAKEAFQRALDSKALSPELQAFVQQKLKEL